MGGIVGRTYSERGEPVVIVAQWHGMKLPPIELAEGEAVLVTLKVVKRRPWIAPRNVLIRRADGTLVVRPFRGLRRIA